MVLEFERLSGADFLGAGDLEAWSLREMRAWDVRPGKSEGFSGLRLAVKGLLALLVLVGELVMEDRRWTGDSD